MPNLIFGIGDEVIQSLSIIFILFVIFFFIYKLWLRNIFRNYFFGQPNQADRDAPHAPSSNFSNGQCPICLNNLTLPVQCNCGHTFCGPCMSSFFNHRDMNAILYGSKCPLCRQQIRMLFICFPNNDGADETQQEIISMVQRYNRNHSGQQRTFIEVLRDWPTLMRHLWNEFFTVSDLVNFFRLRVAFCFITATIYLISPLDFLPEAVFGILGLIDDIMFIVMIGIYISIIYRRLILDRER